MLRNNMTDSELLAELNALADDFEKKQGIYSEDENTNGRQFGDEMRIDSVPDLNTESLTNPEFKTEDTRQSDYIIDKDGNMVLNNIRPSAQRNVFRITPDRAVSADYTSHKFLYKRRKTLFESEYGIAYTYKKSWEELLDCIIQRFGGDASVINNFGIRDGIILAKKLEVDPSKFEDDELGISIYDMIEFRTLFDKLPMIERLVLDSHATQRMVNTYGDSAQSIWQMFQEAKNLRLLRIKTNNGWKDYRRDSMNEQAKDLDNELKKSRAAAELDYTCDTKNPRKESMKKGYIYGVRQNAREMRKHSFGIAKEAFMAPKPKLITSAFYSVLGVGLVGVGVITAILGGGQQLFRKR